MIRGWSLRELETRSGLPTISSGLEFSLESQGLEYHGAIA